MELPNVIENRMKVHILPALGCNCMFDILIINVTLSIF